MNYSWHPMLLYLSSGVRGCAQEAVWSLDDVNESTSMQVTETREHFNVERNHRNIIYHRRQFHSLALDSTQERSNRLHLHRERGQASFVRNNISNLAAIYTAS